MTNVNDLSQEDLIRIVSRDRFIKEMLTSRLASVVAENVELLAMVRELQEQQPQPPDGDIPMG